MANQKPVKKPVTMNRCETCLFRSGDFWNDPVYTNIVRCYCRARHVNVDAEAMSKDCDFWKINPDYQAEKEEPRYGL